MEGRRARWLGTGQLARDPFFPDYRTQKMSAICKSSLRADSAQMSRHLAHSSSHVDFSMPA